MGKMSFGIKVNGLISGVVTSHVAFAAVDTHFLCQMMSKNVTVIKNNQNYSAGHTYAYFESIARFVPRQSALRLAVYYLIHCKSLSWRGICQARPGWWEYPTTAGG